MDFSLSSSLVGSAVSNPDKLALDLQFAADKTLTARKGPTPAFTRGSMATFVDSDGLVRYAPNNSSLYSGQLVIGTGWAANSTPSVTSIVDGLGPDGNNAYEVAEAANTGSHTLFNTGGTGTTGATSVVNGTNYTGSIFVKKVAGSVDWIQLSFSTVGFGSAQYANFNISNGTIGNFSSSSPQIQAAGNGWYRCSISAAATVTTTTTSNLFLAFTNNTDTVTRLLSYAGNTANKVLAAMCQFEIGSTVNTYNPTTTAAFQGPRFDHDPITLACKGLLIEESRTNNALYSSAIVSGVGWVFSQVTSVIDAAGPDGNNAYTITEDAVLAIHAFGNTGGSSGTAATSVVVGTTYTGSVFLKKVTGSIDWVQLTMGSGGFGTAQYANFNLSNGTIGNSSGATPRIENYGNGWYRCSIAVVATATTSTTNNINVGFTNNTNGTTRLPSYAGSTANKFLASLCQFETGSFATSYIPTTTSSVIRSADVCSISGSAFSGFYNPLEGSFATSQIFNAPATVAQGQVVFDVNDTTILNRTRPVRNATNGFLILANTVNGTQDVSIIGSTAMNAGAVTKLAGCMKANDFTIYLNNVSQGVDTVATMQSAPTTLTIGNLTSGSGTRAPINGTISSIRYFKKRLPNEKLASFTV